MLENENPKTRGGWRHDTVAFINARYFSTSNRGAFVNEELPREIRFIQKKEQNSNTYAADQLPIRKERYVNANLEVVAIAQPKLPETPYQIICVDYWGDPVVTGYDQYKDLTRFLGHKSSVSSSDSKLPEAKKIPRQQQQISNY